MSDKVVALRAKHASKGRRRAKVSAIDVLQVLRERDRHSLVEVATLSLKLVVLGYVDNHVQVTRRATLSASLPFTRYA